MSQSDEKLGRLPSARMYRDDAAIGATPLAL
jgi:hypothetical protein